MKRMSTGATLVELMIAMVIGLFLVAATGSVYLANKDTYRTSEIVSRMQENGRVALHVIANDLKMAGFLGNNINPSLVDARKGTSGQLPPLSASSGTQDCANRWYIDTDAMLVVGNDQPPSLNGTSFATTCLDGKDYQATTDVIALKRAATGAIDDTNASPHDTWTLIRSDLAHGTFFFGGDPVPAGINGDMADNRRWLAHVYFVAWNGEENAVPELTRLVLGRGPNLHKRELVPGVQDLQVLLGIDADDNGTPDRFVEPGTEGNAKIVAARIWLLMRSETREIEHDDSANTYEYAGKIYTPGDDSTDNGTETAEHPKQFRRLLLSTTVMLRNNWN